MKPLSDDTTPEAHAVQIMLLRRMTPSQRAAIALRLRAAAHAAALDGIARRHPDATARERRLYLASQWLDDDTMKTVFGWDPEVRGR